MEKAEHNGQKQIDDTFKTSFFFFPEQEMTRFIYQGKSPNLTLIYKFTDAFDKYIQSSNGKISEEISCEFVDLAKTYAKLEIENIEQCRKNPSAGVPYNRLYTLIQHPGFIADKCAVQVIENAMKTENAMKKQNPGPWGHEIYCDHEQVGNDPKISRYNLREGFGKAQIEGFDRLVHSDLWYGKNDDKKVFIAAISQVLGKLSEEYPDETLDARMRLMERSIAIPDMDTSPIQHGYVYSFRTEIEKSKLKEVVESVPSTSRLAIRCKDILDGKFNETTKWF